MWRYAIGIVVLLWISLYADRKADAEFKCGPHFTVFRVEGLDGERAPAVRCVRFLHSTQRFMWYGEGAWGQALYRHIGLYNERQRTRFMAADFAGNGETTHNIFFEQNPDVTFGRKRNWNEPIGRLRSIEIGNPWREVWVKVSGDSYRDYASLLPEVSTCGPHFRSYILVDSAGQPRQGLRCEFEAPGMWYGKGPNYRHIGYTTQAYDICGPQPGLACNSFSPGSLQFDRELVNGGAGGVIVHLRGAWNENWQSNRPVPPLR